MDKNIHEFRSEIVATIKPILWNITEEGILYYTDAFIDKIKPPKIRKLLPKSFNKIIISSYRVSRYRD